MKTEKLAEDIHWVGAIDWDIREFHGLSTLKGGTYNSFLIIDEKTALIDAVKDTKIDVLLSNIAALIDPAKIDYVISNHAEPDHSGGLPRVMEIAGNASLVATPNGVKRLTAMYGQEWDFKAVRDGDELSLGKRNLKFIHAPLLHWPETMFTYERESRILFSCDAFGAHIATSERFTDEVGIHAVLAEAKKYYAFLVAPFRSNVLRALAKIDGLAIEAIAPSHGPVWRRDLNEIVDAYAGWANLDFEDKATVVYGSMWGNTAMMAAAVAEGVTDGGFKARVFNVQETLPSEIVAEIFDSRLVLMGSSTFVNGIYPPVEAFIPFMRVPRDRSKKVACFGSYGWSGGSVKKLNEILGDEGYAVMEPGLTIQFTPDGEGMEACFEFGRMAAAWSKDETEETGKAGSGSA